MNDDKFVNTITLNAIEQSIESVKERKLTKAGAKVTASLLKLMIESKELEIQYEKAKFQEFKQLVKENFQ